MEPIWGFDKADAIEAVNDENIGENTNYLLRGKDENY